MMMLKELGLTKDALTEMVVDRLVEQALTSLHMDDEGNAFARGSSLDDRLRKTVVDQINIAIENAANKHLAPRVQEIVENVNFQETNQWGEKKGTKSMTFKEYLADKAEKFLMENVDSDGKVSTYGKNIPRINWLIDRYMHSTINEALTG